MAPTSVVPNWRAEAAKFTPSLRVLVLGRALQIGGELGTVHALVKVRQAPLRQGLQQEITW